MHIGNAKEVVPKKHFVNIFGIRDEIARHGMHIERFRIDRNVVGYWNESIWITSIKGRDRGLIGFGSLKNVSTCSMRDYWKIGENFTIAFSLFHSETNLYNKWENISL